MVSRMALSTTGGSPVVIQRNEYDGLNRRAVKQYDSQAPSSPDGLDAYRHYYYDAG